MHAADRPTRPGSDATTGTLPAALAPGLGLPDDPDQEFDRYARLVRTALGVPVGLVSLVTVDGQVFPGAQGLPDPWQQTRRTGLSHSFCQHVVARDAPLVVADARQEPLLADNLAIPDIGVVAYAGFPVRDADGSPVGSLCAIDTQPRTWTQRELDVLADLAGAVSAELHLRRSALLVEEARRAEHAAASRVAEITESMAVGYLATDTDWRITYANAEAVAALGRPREELVGGVVWELFPGTVGTDFETGYRRAADTGQAVTFDAYYPQPLDAWYEVRATPERGGVALYFVNITDRVRAHELLELEAERQQLLGTASEVLASTMDAEAAATLLVQQLVPALGDWCILTLVDDDERAGARRGLRDVASWHHDPTRRSLVQAYARQRIDALGPRSLLGQALATGQPISIDSGATDAIRAVMRPEPGSEVLDLLDQLAPTSMLALPLRGRGRTVGILTLYADTAPSGLAADGALRTDLAARAGLALDSSRLYRQQRDLAAGLQQALLTEPPEPDHAQTVVRYAPAAETAQVGGDWYDAFIQREGATVLVIGDVLGHDTQAAAAMSQVRTILRTVGTIDDHTPAHILTRTDEAMRTLDVRTTATALVARLEQDPDERARGVTRLRWSSAGHPPAMVINPDGTVTALTVLSNDLILGIDPTTDRRDQEVVLDRGATVLLYTDGLVERRGQSLQEGLEQLHGVLTDLAGEDRGLDALVDDALAEMLPAHPEDDVALIAVRLHRQDRPRPPEAGPRSLPPGVPAEEGTA